MECSSTSGKKDIEIGARDGVDGGDGCRLKREFGLEGNSKIGEVRDVVEERRIKAEGEIRERLEQRWVRRILAGEHTGRCQGGFAEGRTTIEDDDAGSSAGKLKRERETDDAGSGDTNIGMPHEPSLVDMGMGREAIALRATQAQVAYRNRSTVKLQG